MQKPSPGPLRQRNAVNVTIFSSKDSLFSALFIYIYLYVRKNANGPLGEGGGQKRVAQGQPPFFLSHICISAGLNKRSGTFVKINK